MLTTSAEIVSPEQMDAQLMSVIRDCATIETSAQFSEFMATAFCSVLPHDILHCGIHGITEQGNQIHKMLSRNYPHAYLEEIRTTMGKVDTPLMKKWRASRVPEGFQSGRDDHDFPDEWVRLFNKYDLRNAIGHGVTDIAGTLGSFFLFYRLPLEIGPAQATLLKIVTPHLHLALVRAAATIEEAADQSGVGVKTLNDRQRKILYWLHEGKTNWEIATILDITERNVKYHIKQIFLILEVHSRAHAVAKALALGLLIPAAA
ncbi:hypothetical protein BH11PSE11_BH11PSE11_35430 [soil metagenome]